MANLYGDIELDAQGMRALAHPVRLSILLRLQEHGPSTATALSPHVGASPSVTSWHLRHLAKHQLVHDAKRQGSGRERWWEAARGFRFAATDAAGQDAQRLLSRTLEQVEGDLVGQWSAEVEPHLEREWRALAGRANTTVLLTRDELAELEHRIEELLAPFVLRKDADPSEFPKDARMVRLLRYTLPGQADQPDDRTARP
jgi:DNA-binding transcriptional ArsR family regulator